MSAPYFLPCVCTSLASILDTASIDPSGENAKDSIAETRSPRLSICVSASMIAARLTPDSNWLRVKRGIACFRSTVKTIAILLNRGRRLQISDRRVLAAEEIVGTPAIFGEARGERVSQIGSPTPWINRLS
jgi:hypothetical protein